MRTWRKPDRYWLHALLVAITLLTTTVAGAELNRCFVQGIPYTFRGSEWLGYARAWREPAFLLSGLPFSAALFFILMAHEMGHYIAARLYSVDASLPYFLPSPTLIGTFGAFIRIRSPIFTKRALFDIGIAGPIAGFVALVLVLGAGLGLSRVVPGAVRNGDFAFGVPLLIRAGAALRFPGVPAGDVLLHPVARAAWVGALTTALNLIPIGQLDGGHILYSLLGERSRKFSRFFIILLIPMAYFAFNWLIWAILLFFLAFRHPSVPDETPLDRYRVWWALGAGVILLLCFMLTPVDIRPLRL